MRYQFTFYKSFDDVYQDLNNKQKIEFIDVLLDVQFLRIRVENVVFKDPILKHIWNAQKHSIERSIQGYIKSQKSKNVETPLLGVYGASDIPSEGGQDIPSEGGQEPHPTESKRKKEREKEIEDEFANFWNEYPKKRAKVEALKAFKKRYKELPPIDELVEIVKLHKQTEDWKKEKGQFIPNPATWLNQGRWEDEIEDPKEESIYDKYPWIKEVEEG